MFTQIDFRNHIGGGSSEYQYRCLANVTNASTMIPEKTLSVSFHVSWVTANRSRPAPPRRYRMTIDNGNAHRMGIPSTVSRNRTGSGRTENAHIRGARIDTECYVINTELAIVDAIRRSRKRALFVRLGRSLPRRDMILA